MSSFGNSTVTESHETNLFVFLNSLRKFLDQDLHIDLSRYSWYYTNDWEKKAVVLYINDTAGFN